MHCPASIRLSEAWDAEHGEPPAGDASRFGTRVHELAERWLRNPALDITQLNVDEVAAALPYVEYCRMVFAGLCDMMGTAQVFIERRLASGVRDCWGTCDCVLIAGNEAWVIDLKTGGGLVAAERNPQLMIYACGLLRLAPDVTRFNIVIVQARDLETPIKTWSCTREELMGFRGELRAAVRAADMPNTQPVTGDHCQYCHAQPGCRAHVAQTTAVFGSSIVEPSPLQAAPTPASMMTPEALANVIRLAPQIRRWLDSCDEYALANPPPGFRVVQGNGRARWRDEALAVEQLRLLGLSPRMSPVTITEARRVAPAEALAPLIETPPGRPTLVREDDPRPSLDRSAVFALPGDEPANPLR